MEKLKLTSMDWLRARIQILEAENNYLRELCVKLIAILKSVEVI